MRAKWLPALILAGLTIAYAGQQPKSQSNPATSADGVFLGRSGKPMAGARLILCEARTDVAKIRILAGVPTATVDPQGRFTLKNFEPGRWTLIYLPAGYRAAIPNEIDYSALDAVDKNPLPLLVRVELGKDKPYEARRWTSQFTLLKGHTFWSLGANMKIWNATVRRGPQGPFMELRRGRLWLENFEDKCQVKFDAWSY